MVLGVGIRRWYKQPRGRPHWYLKSYHQGGAGNCKIAAGIKKFKTNLMPMRYAVSHTAT